MPPKGNINAHPVPLGNDLIPESHPHPIKHLKFIVGFLKAHLPDILIGTPDERIIMRGDPDIAPGLEKHF